MPEELRYAIFNVGLGWMGVLGSGSGLLKATLPQSSAREAEQLLGDRLKDAVRFDGYFADLIERLKGYFDGQRLVFDDELDLSGASRFQREVWQMARLIPYGETRSYGWIAESLAKAGAGRAVGQALCRNPLPIIIPCHRVVAKDGSLGGYSWGIDRKRYLLRLESAATGR